MSFLLRILFSGLIAFVPSPDGKELTVLLLNVGHDYHTSDGTSPEHHKPLLLARAGNCSGDCPTRDADIAEYLFEDESESEALDSLEEAVTGGGAWELAGSDLSLRKGDENDPNLPPLVMRTGVRGSANGQPLPIPTTSAEREDVSWIADLKQICPTGCTVNPAVLASQPPSGVVAARLRLRSGNVFTYSVARIGSNVTPVHFQRLDGQGSASPYSQAVASWVGADIEVSGDSIELVEEKFSDGTGRSMTLTPDADGKVELAVLNMPPFVPPATTTFTSQVGKHFEKYYEVSEDPQTPETRLVPWPGAADPNASYPEVDWQFVHPQEQLWSELLNKVRLNAGRSVYDRLLCPPVIDPYP